MKFFETPHCTTHAHCKRCRDLDGGRRFRGSIGETYDIPELDFVCPEGFEWGSAPARKPSTPPKKRIVKFLKDGRVLIDGKECKPCTKKRKQRRDELESKRGSNMVSV